jgi:hypothetical protein
VGKFACRCGYLPVRTDPEPGTQYVTVPDEEADDAFSAEPGAPGPADLAGRPTLTECSNRGRLHLERQGPGSPIGTYRRDDGYPRVWADFSDTDELGRVLLRGDRSLHEIADQRLLLQPPVYLVLYDDQGNETPGEAHFGLAVDGGYNENLWAVILDQG